MPIPVIVIYSNNFEVSNLNIFNFNTLNNLIKGKNMIKNKVHYFFCTYFDLKKVQFLGIHCSPKHYHIYMELNLIGTCMYVLYKRPTLIKKD